MAAMAAAENDEHIAEMGATPEAEQPAELSAAENLDEILNAEVDALIEPPADEDTTTMSVADAVVGGAGDIESFLDSEDYEYTVVNSGAKTLFLLKTDIGNALALVYDNGEFESLEPGYSRDGKKSYIDIMNVFVKETISSGGCTGIKRHKGNKVV